MHPIVINQMAADHRTRLLAEAAVRRQQRASAERTRRTPRWRSVPARLLVGAARRLDPGTLRRVDPGPEGPRVAVS